MLVLRTSIILTLIVSPSILRCPTLLLALSTHTETRKHKNTPINSYTHKDTHAHTNLFVSLMKSGSVDGKEGKMIGYVFFFCFKGVTQCQEERDGKMKVQSH